MSNKNRSFIYSGAYPQEVKQDLQSLMDFQDDGMTLKDLNQIIEDSLIPHMVQYDRPDFQSLYNFFLKKVPPSAPKSP